MKRLLWLTTILFALPACRSAVHHDPVRAVWVTRYDYKTEDDVRQVMANCMDLGFNTVMFQVRGNGTAFYQSSFEPWADELGGQDPGYDPLRLAVELAHERDVSLHAWVNAVPSWRGGSPPTNEQQLYVAHPEWHWFDQDGTRQPLAATFYVSLNPCLPEVREYLVDTLREIVEEYDVDGLHLDYIRFVDDLIEKGRDYPRDAKTLALYREATGLAPDDDLDQWKRWKADQVTELVRVLRDAVKDANGDAWLSAAVAGKPEGPLAQHQRDSITWVESGLVDAVYPMNYTADLALFKERTLAWASERDRLVGEDADGVSGDPSPFHVVTGINIPLDRELDLIRSEVRTALSSSSDFCVFAYSYLFDPPNPGSKQDQAARAARRALVGPYLSSGAAPRL